MRSQCMLQERKDEEMPPSFAIKSIHSSAVEDFFMLKNRGDELRGLNFLQQALAYYQAALAIDPQDVATLLGQGHALRDLRFYEQALISYKAAFKSEIDIQSRDPNKLIIALNSQGAVLYDLKRYKSALVKFESALIINPRNTPALIGSGNAYLELKDPEKALLYFETALKFDPKNISAQIGRGHALRDLNCLQEALDSFNAALQVEAVELDLEENVSALLGKGHALHNLKRYAEALECYKAAWTIDPQDPAASTSHGLALISLGKPAKAIVSFDVALKIDPNYTPAIEGRQRCLKQLPNAKVSQPPASEPITVTAFKEGVLSDNQSLASSAGQHESKQKPGEEQEKKREKFSARTGVMAFFRPNNIAVKGNPATLNQDNYPPESPNQNASPKQGFPEYESSWLS